MRTGIPIFVDTTSKGQKLRPKLVYARAMEFGEALQTEVLYYPTGCTFASDLISKDHKGSTVTVPGMTWPTEYAFLGPNGMGTTSPVEGFNEKGLLDSLYYFPGYAKFEDLPEDSSEYKNCVSPVDLVPLLLGTCTTTKEVKEKLKNLKIVESYFEELKGTPPVHWIIQDQYGEAITLEYEEGKQNIYENPVNLITNSPSFGWHMTNLNNYVNLTADNVEETPGSLASQLGVKAFGQGSGMLGLPGDFTPPSRFVRAVALSTAVKAMGVSASPEDGVNLAWNLINNISIAKGCARGSEGPGHYDYTQWTSVSDLHNLKYYIRTYDNQNIRVIDLKTLMTNKMASMPLTIAIERDVAAYRDITSEAEPVKA